MLSVDGTPRRTITERADGSAASDTFGGSGISTSTVASFSIRDAPFPFPSSLPSWMNNGSLGFFANRRWASAGDTVPLPSMWHVAHVRPFPPNVSRSNRCLPAWRSGFFSFLSFVSSLAATDVYIEMASSPVASVAT